MPRFSDAKTAILDTPARRQTWNLNQVGDWAGFDVTDDGEPTVLDADWTADGDGESDYANTILFAGYRYDSECGLYHVRNRSYSAWVGRFIQRDPIGYADGTNAYVAYFVPDRTDPAGLRKEKPDCLARERCRTQRTQCIIRVGDAFIKCMSETGYSFSGPGIAATVTEVLLWKTRGGAVAGPVGILIAGTAAASGITVYQACDRTRRWGEHECEEAYRRCLHPNAPRVDSKFWERERILTEFKAAVDAATREELKIALEQTKQERDAEERLRQVLRHLARARGKRTRKGSRR
jgi:RHS repeat-associated protein